MNGRPPSDRASCEELKLAHAAPFSHGDESRRRPRRSATVHERGSFARRGWRHQKRARKVTRSALDINGSRGRSWRDTGSEVNARDASAPSGARVWWCTGARNEAACGKRVCNEEDCETNWSGSDLGDSERRLERDSLASSPSSRTPIVFPQACLRARVSERASPSVDVV